MSIYIGNTEITQMGKITIGTTDIKEVYVGGTKVWPLSVFAPNEMTVKERSSCYRTLALSINPVGSPSSTLTTNSENCVFKTSTIPYTMSSGITYEVEATPGTQGSCPGVLSLKIIRDDYVLIYSQTLSVGASGSLATTFTPASGRQYRVEAEFTANDCNIV